MLPKPKIDKKPRGFLFALLILVGSFVFVGALRLLGWLGAGNTDFLQAENDVTVLTCDAGIVKENTAIAGPFFAEGFQDEILWLKDCQLPNGAVAQTPGHSLVIPYFANLAAKVMVDYDPSWSLAYMDWYLCNLNVPDKWGIEGTVYDYEMKSGQLVSTRNYDSADSYASTFLSLVSYYCENTGNFEFVQSNKASLDKVAGVILGLMDQDGLVRAKPNSGTKYLMDNAEAYRGLLDWAETLTKAGFLDDAETQRILAGTVREAVLGIMFDPKTGDYAWSLSWYGKRFPRKGKWYPDAVSQIFLLSSGLIDLDGPEAAGIWERFNSKFPKWSLGETGDDFPWAEIAVASAVMGDTDLAGAFVGWASEKYPRRQYPWHVLESSNLIRALEMLGYDTKGP